MANKNKTTVLVNNVSLLYLCEHNRPISSHKSHNTPASYAITHHSENVCTLWDGSIRLLLYRTQPQIKRSTWLQFRESWCYACILESLACDFEEPSFCGYDIEGNCDTFYWSPQPGQGDVTINDNHTEFSSDQGKCTSRWQWLEYVLHRALIFAYHLFFFAISFFAHENCPYQFCHGYTYSFLVQSHVT